MAISFSLFGETGFQNGFVLQYFEGGWKVKVLVCIIWLNFSIAAWNNLVNYISSETGPFNSEFKI